MPLVDESCLGEQKLMTGTTQQSQYPVEISPEIDSSGALKPSLAFLKTSITTLMLGAVVAVIAQRIVAPDQIGRSLAPLLVFIIALLSWYFLSRGKILTSKYVLAIGVWLVVAAAAVFTGGVRAPVLMTYPAIIISTAWLIHTRMAGVMTALTVVATIGTGLAESWDLLPKSWPSSTVMYVGDQIVIYVLSATLAAFLVRSYRSRVDELEKVIAGRQQAEQALLRSKKQYDDLVSKIPFGTYILSSQQDGSFALIYVSPRAAELFNASEQSLLADPIGWTQAIYPDDRDDFLKLNQEGIERLRSFVWSGRVQSQGQVKFLRIESSPDPQEDGEVHWHGIVEDITERKRTEQLLQEREAHLRAIVENEPECIKIVDGQGLLIQMNPTGLAMIEADSFEQVKGASVFELIAPEYREAYMDMHKRVIAGEAGTLEYEMAGLKGGRRWLETRAVPMNVHGETVHLAVTRDNTQRKQLDQQVRQLAFHDALTNLPNRRLLIDRLEQAMAASKRSSCYGALLFLDLDNFKPLNDKHGHKAGDLLLIEVARRLTNSVREVDTVSRFGGDEFVVLLGELTMDQVHATEQSNKLAEKVRTTLAQPYLLSDGNESQTIEHHCSASIGVVLFSKEHQNVETLLKWVDAAMYQSKAEGRNRITFMAERRKQQRA